MMTHPDFPYSFDPSGCAACGGHCCIGESGHVWVSMGEMEKIADFTGLEIEEFLKQYVKKVWYKYSLKELKIGNDNHACVFFDEDRKGCSIYPVRPKQCCDFPFWEHFRIHPEEAYAECPALKPLPSP